MIRLNSYIQRIRIEPVVEKEIVDNVRNVQDKVKALATVLVVLLAGPSGDATGDRFGCLLVDSYFKFVGIDVPANIFKPQVHLIRLSRNRSSLKTLRYFFLNSLIQFYLCASTSTTYLKIAFSGSN